LDLSGKLFLVARRVFHALIALWVLGGAAVVVVAGLSPSLPKVTVTHRVQQERGYEVAVYDYTIEPADAEGEGPFLLEAGDLPGRLCRPLGLDIGVAPETCGRPFKTLMVYPGFHR
jgi:hypothetical protein